MPLPTPLYIASKLTRRRLNKKHKTSSDHGQLEIRNNGGLGGESPGHPASGADESVRGGLPQQRLRDDEGDHRGQVRKHKP